MKTQIKNGLIVLMLSILTGTLNVHAQNPQLPEPLSKLMRLEGKWKGDATLVLSGTTYILPYSFDFHRTAGGSGLYMDEGFQHSDLGVMKGGNIIGYNANDEKLHWFSVDNFGTCHDHLGTWLATDHLYMEATEVVGGQAFLEKIHFNFIGNNKVEVTLEASLDGQVFQTLSGTLQRH